MDYQALIERLRIYSVEIETSTYLGEVIHRLMEDAANAIETLMAERDKKAVPVVRCKDCKHYHWKQEPCHGKTEHLCDKLKMEVFKDFYCWFGKKKGGNENG